jgi:O-antigen/teichoic acid export membrane protein
LKPFDQSGAFRPTSGGLRRLAIRGAAVTVSCQGIALAIQVVATVVLARLLMPADFGVVAMVTTFSLLVVNFGANGLTEAVLKWEEIDHALASNLFWINLAGGVLLTVAFAAVGPLLGWFYSDPRVTKIALGVSSTIFITSTSVLHLALLKRAMRFTAVSVNDVFARIVSVAVSVFFAWRGWGYWALVAGIIALPLSTSVGAMILCRWLPGLPRRVNETTSVVRFALHVYGQFCVNYFARNTDNLLVGWRFNAQALGFYKKAYDLFALTASQLVSPLTSVAVSALSRLNQNSIQYRRYLLSSLGVIAFVGMGIGANLTLVGKDVIRLLLGPGWDESGRIFTFFGPGIGIMLLYGTHGWIHLSIGRADRWLRWGILEFAVTCLLFLAGLPWGPRGIAVAWTASFWILTLPAFWYAGKPIDLSVKLIVAEVWRYLLASLAAGLAAAAIIRNLPFFAQVPDAKEAFERILLLSLLFTTLYLGMVILLHQGFAPLHRVAGLLREMMPTGMRSRKSTHVVPVDAASGEAAAP